MRLTPKRIAARASLALTFAARQKSRSGVTPRDRRGTTQAIAPGAPSADALIRLRQACQRKVWPMRYGALNDGAERRISREFARELRKRGWLHEEGYADVPNNWAAQR